MRLLVTGGAGFIGSHFTRFVLNKYPNYHVNVLDALTYAGNLENLKDVWDNQRFKFFPGKIQDACVVEGIIRSEKISHIVNFAAESHNDRSLIDPGSFILTDVYGVYVLLETTRKYKLERMLHVSTDEVYGTISTGHFTEDSPIIPNTPYSASKAGGDLQCRAHYKAFSTPVIVTRGGNNYGPYQYPEKLIPFFVTRLIDGKKVPVYGEGNQVREWIHVLDHCEGIDCILHNGRSGEIYNIGDDNEIQNMEIVKVLLEETSRDISYIKKIEDPRKDSHDLRYSMNCAKVQALGWKPAYDFKKELQKTVQWYKDNESWWRPIVQSLEYIEFVTRIYRPGLGADL